MELKVFRAALKIKRRAGFTGDTIWFGSDGGYSFINSLAEDNDLAKQSLAKLEKLLRERSLSPKIITGHTGGVAGTGLL